MRYKIYISLLILLFSTGLFAQPPGANHIRIVDTLTVQEKMARNPVISKAELDSLIAKYNITEPQQVIKEPVKETSDSMNQYIFAGLLAIIALLGFIIYLSHYHRKKITHTIAGLKENLNQPGVNIGSSPCIISKERKGKNSVLSAESKINDLNAELNKLLKENEGLNSVIKEYNGIKHEYDSLKHGILKSYKVKNYPGYDNTKDETLVMQGVLQTENSVAAYAYEKFLKPILFITDANKNNPAKLSIEDQEKLLELLVSLSLLYIEYLYLRVSELSIGGNMVERIHGFSKGNGLDAALLKKLNMEFGSRALVIKMALQKAELNHLSYPVFDETNLNN